MKALFTQKYSKLVFALGLGMGVIGSSHFIAVAESAEKVVMMSGAGATFPYPIYSAWFAQYRKLNPSVEINYQSVGSGAGIRQLLDKTVDFGASDATMSDEQLASASPKVLHLPTVLGAVVLTYNVPGLDASTSLKLSPATVADIFLGNVKTWNDAKIVADNPGVKLPSTALLPVTRSDGSGTTAVFTDYLSKVSSDWKSKVGAGTAIKWPAGRGGKGNEGVTGMVKQTPGSIGYVELIYATTNKLPVAQLKNAEGKFIAPSLESVTAASQALVSKIPEDYRISITNAPGASSYPVSAFTYLLVYQTMPKAKADALKGFLKFAYGDGQKEAASKGYAPLPATILAKVKKTAETIVGK